MASDDDTFDPLEMEEILEALYSPGNYAEGEELCLHILEEVDPDWEPARLYLLLNLAALEAPEDALELIDELQDESLFEALRHLAFGLGIAAETTIYKELMACARERGLGQQLDAFLSTLEKPMARQDLNSSLQAWE